MFGVFDGMGGEECGEIASFLAAKKAEEFKPGEDLTADLRKYCSDANGSICRYAEDHSVFSMGTTAAILAFDEKEIMLCNIGDSKIFRLSDGKMDQISYDHVAISAFGTKPPLSQNLGIPPEEMIISPYFSKGTYHDGDVYLICSDGLTDMVKNDVIAQIVFDNPLDKAIELLVSTALENGGKDNVTAILLRIDRKTCAFKRLFRRVFKKNG